MVITKPLSERFKLATIFEYFQPFLTTNDATMTTIYHAICYKLCAFGRLLLRLTVLWLTMIALWLAPMASAAEQLDVSVDKTQLYANETLELRVIGNIEFELSFGTLFNLRSLNLPEPDADSLEQYFEILNKNQQYNVRSINGENRAEITWTYTLAPKVTGNIIIPAIKFKEAESSPISINVLPGTAKRSADDAPSIFLELVVDKESVYTQEQVLVSLRLYHQGNLASGELSKPEPENAIVEPLGEQTKYTRMKYNRRYEVIERNYLIFPQKSGVLKIEPQVFTGSLIDPRARQRQFARELTEPKSIEVKSPPASFSGNLWMPAMSINLTESWSKPIESIRVGESVTRTLNLQALGMLGSALPSFSTTEPAGFKFYPDQEKRVSEPHKSGANSTLSQSFAIVAVQPGKVTLPEIRIPWWDTVNNVERVAILPGREIQILPATTQTPISPTVDAMPVQVPLQEMSIEKTPSETASTYRQVPAYKNIWFWCFVTVLAAWLATIIYFVRKTFQLRLSLTSVSHKPFASQPRPLRHGRVMTKDLVAAVASNKSNAIELLIEWSRQLQANQGLVANPIHSFDESMAFFSDSPDLVQWLRKIEASIYGSNRIHWDQAQLHQLEQAFTTAKEKKSSDLKKDKSENTLPKFYPSS